MPNPFNKTFVILIFALAGSVAFGLMLQLKLDVAQTNIELLEIQKTSLLIDLNALSDVVATQEAEQQRLMLELDLSAALNKQNAIEKERINKRLVVAKSKLTHMVKSNETLQIWGDTAVPNDVAQLLQHATHCTNSNSHTDRVCVPP
ncbi:hypothetical protein [Shewanella surugensis]|uniref:LysB family phage lysis regulatory protein n=1 Tax=Shewanella surugensis TaxID=212020 RepID=A0ABT0L8X1_9GAMM|nr:hypothetical protein [Shewanella surugensis]MCL1124147.1 hypothetical protein [Shewanella surugensis]